MGSSCRDFSPWGKAKQEKPADFFTAVDMFSLCYKGPHRLPQCWTQLIELPESHSPHLLSGAGHASSVKSGSSIISPCQLLTLCGSLQPVPGYQHLIGCLSMPWGMDEYKEEDIQERSKSRTRMFYEVSNIVYDHHESFPFLYTFFLLSSLFFKHLKSQ